MEDELFIIMVPDRAPCDCATLGGCTSITLSATVRHWNELLEILDDHPHMRAVALGRTNKPYPHNIYKDYRMEKP